MIIELNTDTKTLVLKSRISLEELNALVEEFNLAGWSIEGIAQSVSIPYYNTPLRPETSPGIYSPPFTFTGTTTTTVTPNNSIINMSDRELTVTTIPR